MKRTSTMIKMLLGAGLVLLLTLMLAGPAGAEKGTVKQIFTSTTGIVTVTDNEGDPRVPNGADINYEDSTLPSRGGVVIGDNVSFDIIYIRDISGRWLIATNLIKIESATLISIDIKPGSFPNSINPRSKGVIPVAILTTETFDAATVDSTTVLFGPSGTEAAPAKSALLDVDGDGDIDMILHFNTQTTGIQCGDTSATLTGETLDGQMIKGADDINTVGCK